MSNGSDAPPAAPDNPNRKKLLCDIVMAGGVTSGIIYPGAVARIAEKYSFKSIGGTSVGAIAAAVTAAAEYQRRRTGKDEGFRVAERVPQEMATRAPGGRSRLFHLFTPDHPTRENPTGEDTRPMMSLLSPLIGQGGAFVKFARILWGGLKHPVVFLPSAIVVLVGLVTVWTLAGEGHPLLAVPAFLATLALGVGIATLVLGGMVLWRWLPAVARNGFGICTGMSSPAFSVDQGFLGLTPWMHETIQAAAGRASDDNPLTFGDLWSVDDKPGAATGERRDPALPRGIELTMITSDVSRQRSAQFPFLEVPTQLYFDADELKRYFPPSIVEWMVRHAGQTEGKLERGPTVHRLPPAADLPLVLAARMSLSFPVLLAAVPLKAIKYRSKGKHELQPVWYSDGGLTSNFPVHLFDGPVPSRPTFCLNLVAYDTALDRGRRSDEEDTPSANDDEGLGVARSKARSADARDRRLRTDAADFLKPKAEVWEYVGMTKRNEERASLMTPFETSRSGFFSFAVALVNTARFWSDNQLLGAPGVRDRVVHIGLLDDEGGLNLDMPADTVTDLDRRGQAAGRLIAERFNPAATQDPKTGGPISHSFPNHRWVRFRNTMAAVEDFSRRFGAAMQRSQDAAVERGESPLDDVILGNSREPIGYPANEKARQHFQDARDRLVDLANWLVKEETRDPLASYDPIEGSNAPRRTMRFLLRPLTDNDPRAERGDSPNLHQG